MTLKGINVVCSCDNNEYSLFTGLSQGGSQYPLKQYRVEVLFSEFIIDF
jgi:nitrite reductase/ring-hydroxylating ferredoxin subunit